MHVTQFTGYVYALALMTGVLTIPDTAMFTLVSGRVEVAASTTTGCGRRLPVPPAVR
ncbi:MAG: hypothetical protein R3D03_13495 [Geminicoccaceae bacterium]